MFCNKCGNEIMENTKFCPFCGDKTTHSVPLTGIDFQNRSVFEILTGGLLAILVLIWGFGALSGLGHIIEIFSLFSSIYGIIALILYLIPPGLMIGCSIIGVFEILRKKYVFSIGVLLFGIALIVKIGGWIFYSYTFEPAPMIAYTIFTYYSSEAGWTLFLSIPITVMLYSKASANHHNER